MTLEIGDSVVFQVLHDEIVILNIEKQEYYGLDSVGADAWQLLLKHKSVVEAASQLHARYDVDEQTARTDMDALVNELVREGLLKEAPSS